MIDRERVAKGLEAERRLYAEQNPRSQQAAKEATHLFGGVPMTWMAKTAGGFPLFLDRASGARVTTIDGHELVDFCLGDTGAMAGHSPPATVAAVQARYADAGGATAMMPTEDAAVVASELTRRFGVSAWSFALTATDANRWALRLCRAFTGRPKVLVNAWCYHGSVDESLIVTSPSGPVPRPGNVGAPCDVTESSRVAEFNDLVGLEAELAHGDVAVVLMEPALTNMGIVLPEPGYLEGVRRLTREAGTLLIIDETHTLSAGPGGCTKAWGLEPDIVTLGKAIAGGIPIGAYGLDAELAERLLVPRGPRPHRHRWGRRHPGRQRPFPGRGPGHPRAGPDRRRLRDDDRPVHPLQRRGRADHRRPEPAVVGEPARGPLRVSLRQPGPPQRHRVRGRHRRRAGGLPPPLPAEPGGPAHPVPQHGPHVPRDHRSRRRSPPPGPR